MFTCGPGRVSVSREGATCQGSLKRAPFGFSEASGRGGGVVRGAADWPARIYEIFRKRREASTVIVLADSSEWGG
jgi:hypothetical protein